MSKKSQFLVLDIETALTEDGKHIPYDVGCAITDRNANISWTGSFIVQEVFFRQDLMAKAYYCSKMSEYYQKLAKGEATMIPFNSLHKLLNTVVDTYEPKARCAFNAHYDNTGLDNAMKFMGIEGTFFPESFETYDIWAMACQTFMKRKRYIKFCLENGLYRPETGNIKTNAEAAYAYISGNPAFEEEHTGLADVLIECQIMAYAFKCKEKIERGIIPNPWKIPNEQADKWGMKPAPVLVEPPEMPNPRSHEELIEAMSSLLDENN